MSKFKSTYNRKTLVLIGTAVFGSIAFSFLLSSYIHLGNSVSPTPERADLLAEVDPGSEGLSVISNGSRVTRVYGEVQGYLLNDLYILKTAPSNQLVLVHDISSVKPVAGTQVDIGGESSYLYSPAATFGGLQILQLGSQFTSNQVVQTAQRS